MIDFHTHILPKMDDGSASKEESLKMIKKLTDQGVDKIVFTPHFYGEDEHPKRFFERRAKAYEALAEEISDENLKKHLFLGVEVCYYIGVSSYEDIEDFCIEGTPLLLLEMPRTKWDKGMLDEILSLIHSARVIVVLAHIDRYLGFNKINTFAKLRAEGALMQVNTGFIAEPANRRKVGKLLSNDLIQFVGSDCHDLTGRPPVYGKAIMQIEKLGGYRTLEALGYYEEEFFG